MATAIQVNLGERNGGGGDSAKISNTKGEKDFLKVAYSLTTAAGDFSINVTQIMALYRMDCIKAMQLIALAIDRAEAIQNAHKPPAQTQKKRRN